MLISRGQVSGFGLQALAQHPFADVDDEAGFLGQRDEGLPGRSGRGSGAASAAAPRTPSPCPVAHIDQRLVEHLEVAVAGRRGAGLPRLQPALVLLLEHHARLEQHRARCGGFLWRDTSQGPQP